MKFTVGTFQEILVINLVANAGDFFFVARIAVTEKNASYQSQWE